MTTEKSNSEQKLLDDALDRLWPIESYQNEITSCLHEAGFALGEINNILEDFPRDFQEGIEKLSDLLDAAYRLEDWAIGHHQVIQELGEIMTKIEKTQNQKIGGGKWQDMPPDLSVGI